MDAVDWSGLGVLAVLLVACVGYLSRQVSRVEDHLRGEMATQFAAVDARFDRVDARLDRLEERYVRHLEQHATGHPA
jgi:hypothetical protein